ncbi:SdpI family protein [Eggerthella timonensis]|uniref:SdpI family protein n=1 Tax=Eggerthella timonensis TaxID=1871008 RepID=UPI000C76DADE|nr:SdpI family protein [Eggerthella timonensis]
MKNLYRAVFILVALNLAITAAFLALMPDQVPVHFGANGDANRIGSKYEHLWFPALALVFGLGLAFTAKRSDERDGGKLLKADIALLALLLVFSLIIYANAFPESASPFSADLFNVSRGGALIAGIAFIVCGNVMPKSDRNGSFGVRTPWSLSNDEVWRKSQRFGGYAMIAAGALTIAGGLALPIDLVMPAMVVILLATAAASIAATHAYYRKHYEEEA